MLTQQNAQSLSPITLLIPRDAAVEQLDVQLERGQDIHSRRIRSRQELDSARSEKVAWVKSNNELFRTMFSETSIVEQYSTITSTILPEYAGLELFVEQFYEEMEQRLHRLKMIRKMVETVPESRPVVRPIAQAAPTMVEPPQPSEAVVVTEAPAGLVVEYTSPAPTGRTTVQKSSSASKRKAAVPAPAPAAEAPAGVTAPPPTPRSTGVVVLHGQSPLSQPVVEMLRKLGFQPTVFDQGLPHCQEQLESMNGEARFAVLLPEPEAVSAAQAGDAGSVARSLLLELGYCAGRFGRGRTCALLPEGTSPQADELGTSYVPLDPIGGWQLHLAKLLKQAGLEVDLNRLS
jgi:hypothetical protein